MKLDVKFPELEKLAIEMGAQPIHTVTPTPNLEIGQMPDEVWERVAPKIYQETRTIEIPVYRDKNGKPVCYKADLINYCKFLEGHGYLTMCKAGDNPVRQDDEWNGYRPHKNCPLWKQDFDTSTTDTELYCEICGRPCIDAFELSLQTKSNVCYNCVDTATSETLAKFGIVRNVL